MSEEQLPEEKTHNNSLIIVVFALVAGVIMGVFGGGVYDIEMLQDNEAPKWVVLNRVTGSTRIEAWTVQADRYDGWGIVEMGHHTRAAAPSEETPE